MERLTCNHLGDNVIKGCCKSDREGKIEPGDWNPCDVICSEHKNKGCVKCPVKKAVDKLAEYEDLDEKGLILRLPRKLNVSFDDILRQAIANCNMTQKYENPGMEQGLCAGLRTLHGDGEPCETCKECVLYYGYAEE